MNPVGLCSPRLAEETKQEKRRHLGRASTAEEVAENHLTVRRWLAVSLQWAQAQPQSLAAAAGLHTRIARSGNVFQGLAE